MKEDVHYKMTLSYDGTRYKGWQRLKTSEATIQQKVESVLSRIFGQDIEIHGSGRTDAGVHAKNQVAHFKSAKRIEPKLLKEDLNRFLPEDIAINAIAFCASALHPRLNATETSFYHNPVTLGVDIETGGHVFQLLFSNSQAMNDVSYFTNATGISQGKGIYFGFNLYRVF